MTVVPNGGSFSEVEEDLEKLRENVVSWKLKIQYLPVLMSRRHRTMTAALRRSSNGRSSELKVIDDSVVPANFVSEDEERRQ
jgi:hypothetical protein